MSDAKRYLAEMRERMNERINPTANLITEAQENRAVHFARLLQLAAHYAITNQQGDFQLTANDLAEIETMLLTLRSTLDPRSAEEFNYPHNCTLRYTLANGPHVAYERPSNNNAHLEAEDRKAKEEKGQEDEKNSSQSSSSDSEGDNWDSNDSDDHNVLIRAQYARDQAAEEHIRQLQARVNETQAHVVGDEENHLISPDVSKTKREWNARFADMLYEVTTSGELNEQEDKDEEEINMAVHIVNADMHR